MRPRGQRPRSAAFSSGGCWPTSSRSTPVTSEDARGHGRELDAPVWPFGLAQDEITAGAQAVLQDVPQPDRGGRLKVNGHVAAEDEVPGSGLGSRQGITDAPLAGGPQIRVDLPTGVLGLKIAGEE